jgi:DNA-binding transcriptional regulator YhcF (GntR family)
LLVRASRSNGVPAYRQIALDLQRRIDAGEWGAGGQLPTEPQLTAEFGVNRLTVRQAIADLERAGRVIVRHGKGVFVAPPFTQAEIAVDAASQGALGVLTNGQQIHPSLLGAEAQTMLAFLGWIRAEFGSVEGLAAGFGIDQATIASLRRNLLTSA